MNKAISLLISRLRNPSGNDLRMLRLEAADMLEAYVRPVLIRISGNDYEITPLGDGHASVTWYGIVPDNETKAKNGPNP